MPMAEYEAREQELLGDDAHLLAGLTEADEQDAEELGWITLHPSTSEKQP